MLDDLKIIWNKLGVKTRKKHQCFKCHNWKPKGTIMDRTTYSYDEKMFTAYMCEKC